MELNRIVIVGVGLIGGSVALAVRDKHPACEVVGVESNVERVAAAVESKVVGRATTDLSVAADADLIVIAVPVGDAASVMGRLPKLRGIVTDVSSTKRSIVAAAEAGGIRFVGSHPMAGSERQGVGHARADLFDGATCLVTPTDRTDPADLGSVEHFWKSLGVKTRRLSPEAHDRLAAAASHVPHAVAAALVAIQTEESLAIAAGGFRDATRIAGGDAALWRDVLIDNREFVAADLRRMRDELGTLINRLDANDARSIGVWLAAASKRRRGF